MQKLLNCVDVNTIEGLTLYHNEQLGETTSSQGPFQGPFEVPETDPDVLWRELEQQEGAPPLPYYDHDEPGPVGPPPTTGYQNALNANERQAWEELMYSEEYKYMEQN